MARGPFFSNQKPGGGLFGPEAFQTLQRELNRTFDDLWRSMPTGAPEGPAGARSFSVDVHETATQVRVRAELPGVSEADVDVTLDDEKLTIRAERRAESAAVGATAHHAEIGAVTYARTVRLPSPVDPDHVDARMDKGVLIVTLEKPRAAERGRKIKVSTGGAKTNDPPESAGYGIDPDAVSGAGKATTSEGLTGDGYMQGDGARGASPSTGAGDEPDNAAKPGGAVHGYNE